MHNQFPLVPKSFRSLITKDLGTFDAAHQLPFHDSKCRNLHGHTYRVEVTLVGMINPQHAHPKMGMVIDFSLVKEVWETRIKSRVDHALMVGTVPLPWLSGGIEASVGKIARLPIPVTTAEYLSGWMFGEMATGLKELLRAEGSPISGRIHSLTIWETPTSSATCTYEDLLAHQPPSLREAYIKEEWNG